MQHHAPANEHRARGDRMFHGSIDFPKLPSRRLLIPPTVRCPFLVSLDVFLCRTGSSGRSPNRVECHACVPGAFAQVYHLDPLSPSCVRSAHTVPQGVRVPILVGFNGTPSTLPFQFTSGSECGGLVHWRNRLQTSAEWLLHPLRVRRRVALAAHQGQGPMPSKVIASGQPQHC